MPPAVTLKVVVEPAMLVTPTGLLVITGGVTSGAAIVKIILVEIDAFPGLTQFTLLVNEPDAIGVPNIAVNIFVLPFVQNALSVSPGGIKFVVD